MKRQFYFDDVERDLIRVALELWQFRLDTSETSSPGNGHYYAKAFTLRRIAALRKKMAELPRMELPEPPKEK